LISETIPGVGPYISSTFNGGETWTIRSESAKGIGLGYALFRSAGEPVLMQADGATSTFLSLDPNVSRDLRTANHPSIHTIAVANVGTRYWVAGSRSDLTEVANDIPTIMSLASDGTWTEQLIRARGIAELRSIHFANSNDGLVGGVALGDKSAPLIFYTHDGGSQWKEGRLPDELNGMQASGVLCASNSDAWMAANDTTGAGMALLLSEDGGATWTRSPTGVDSVGHVYALGRSAD
jgi:photosystem II stability/assembly factor-like uncharacterized protein